MIKIIKGTYGYYDGRKVIPKTAEDDPFNLTPEQEARLVENKVAEYVNDSAPTFAPDDIENKSPVPYNVNMKLNELKAIASSYGVDASKATVKSKIVEMIDAAVKAEADADQDEFDEEDGEDEEKPPVFDAVLPAGDNADA